MIAEIAWAAIVVLALCAAVYYVFWIGGSCAAHEEQSEYDARQLADERAARQQPDELS